MSYTKQTWTSGDVITAGKMNHMEEGIANISMGLENDKTRIEQIEQRIGNISLMITTVAEAVTATTNNYVEPYTHHYSAEIDDNCVESYGEPISICAQSEAADPVPVRFGVQRRSYSLNSFRVNNSVFITFIKLDIPSIQDDATE